MDKRNPLAGARLLTADDTGRMSPMEQLARVLQQKGIPFERWADELKLTPEQAVAAFYDLSLITRPIQNTPDGDWNRWWIAGGRGAGKTFSSSKYILEEMRDPHARLLLVGPTLGNIRDVNLFGPSGLMTLAPPWMGLKWEPSKKRVKAKNGATLSVFSADTEFKKLKGKAYSGTVCDEVVAWNKQPLDLYNEIKKVTRHRTPRMRKLGLRTRIVISSTPEASDLFELILEDAATMVITRSSSFENAQNLDSADLLHARKMLHSALGKQEALGILSWDHVLDGLFAKIDWLKASIDTEKAPARYERIVIGWDPIQGGVSGRVDETGIVVVGLQTGADGLWHSYILQDASFRTANPKEAAQKVVDTYRHWLSFANKCNVIVETNKGGMTSVQLLKMLEPSIVTQPVLANTSKTARATPLASLLDSGLVHLVGGAAKFKALVDQCRDFTGEPNKNDGRVDAAAWPIFKWSWASSKNRGAIKKLEAAEAADE